MSIAWSPGDEIFGHALGVKVDTAEALPATTGGPLQSRRPSKPLPSRWSDWEVADIIRQRNCWRETADYYRRESGRWKFLAVSVTTLAMLVAVVAGLWMGRTA